MKPFADDSAATSVGDLRLENGRDRIAVYGSLDLTRDQAGLALAREMRQVLESIIQVMEADKLLPASIPPAKPVGTVRNPFS
ncbi:MAG TPA: hypothetical protein VGC15_18880 [Acetobacteraceae bacterium]